MKLIVQDRDGDSHAYDVDGMPDDIVSVLDGSDHDRACLIFEVKSGIVTFNAREVVKFEYRVADGSH